MSATSPAPWEVTSNGGAMTIVARDRSVVAIVMGNGSASPFESSNAALMAAAPDHAALLAAMAKGLVRWEPFNLNTRFADTSRGELCINGLRYTTSLDQFGCPTLTDHIRAALAKANGGCPTCGCTATNDPGVPCSDSWHDLRAEMGS